MKQNVREGGEKVRERGEEIIWRKGEEGRERWKTEKDEREMEGRRMGERMRGKG